VPELEGCRAELRPPRVLRKNILDVAAAKLQSTPARILDIVTISVVNYGRTERRVSSLKDRLGSSLFVPIRFAAGIQTRIDGDAPFLSRVEYPFAFPMAVQGIVVEVDPETGFVKLLSTA